MARIAGVDLPKEKQAWVSLQYLYGVGPARAFQILKATKVKAETKMDELSEAELNRIREYIDREFRVEGELRKEVNLNIKRLIDIGSYRGLRHRRGLPVRGQRTRTNARTRKGKPKTVAGRGQKRGAKK
ncbi:MAG: 30S ribosomal protein S13 [Dehalococcoidia bacterium]|jgi:small subunit ribosomal protein S13|nr:MAG: 30S ribosomal protein S13 [Dehalococcoidia bacterium]